MTLLKNIAIIIVFAIGAMLLPIVVREVYYQYVPAEYLYSILSPVDIVEHENIGACKRITLSMYRNSHITTDAVGTKTLIQGTLVNQSNNREIYTEIKDLVLNDTQGFKYVEFYTTLPCDLEPGNYYIEGNVHFTIEDHEKESPWISEIFLVK